MKNWFKRNKDTILIAGAIALLVFAMSTEERIPEATEPTETESSLIKWKEPTEPEAEPSIESSTVGTVAEPSETEIVEETEMGTEEEVKFFDVPLSEDLQLHIFTECEKHNISPAIVIAMIERESSFRATVMGDKGTSYGLMQIKLKYQKERMDRLGCDDLLDPFQNVTVGIDILAEIKDKYIDVEMALMVYNAGESGAKRIWFDKGIYSSNYSRKVLEACQRLSEDQ